MGNSAFECISRMAQIVQKTAKIRNIICVCKCVISIDFHLDYLFNNQLNHNIHDSQHEIILDRVYSFVVFHTLFLNCWFLHFYSVNKSKDNDIHNGMKSNDRAQKSDALTHTHYITHEHELKHIHMFEIKNEIKQIAAITLCVSIVVVVVVAGMSFNFRRFMTVVACSHKTLLMDAFNLSVQIYWLCACAHFWCSIIHSLWSLYVECTLYTTKIRCGSSLSQSCKKPSDEKKNNKSDWPNNKMEERNFPFMPFMRWLLSATSTLHILSFIIWHRCSSFALLIFIIYTYHK